MMAFVCDIEVEDKVQNMGILINVKSIYMLTTSHPCLSC